LQHPKYRRVVRISKKFYAHDETRQAKTGDTVRIVASRPLSKLKRWRLKEILTHNASVELTGGEQRNEHHDANVADGSRQFRPLES